MFLRQNDTNPENKLFDIGSEDLTRFLWAQPTYSTPRYCDTIYGETNRLSKSARFLFYFLPTSIIVTKK